MHLSDLRRGERVFVTQAQMVVVRADDDVLIRLTRQVRHDVMHGLRVVPDVDVQLDLQLRQRKGLRLQILVYGFRNLAKVMTVGLEPRLGGGGLHLDKKIPASVGPAVFPNIAILSSPLCANTSLIRSTPLAPCILALTALLMKLA